MKTIDNLLRQRLYRTQQPIIEHPPIDLLGAFAEKALGGSDRAWVLEHLAHCGTCRELVFLAAPEMTPTHIDDPSAQIPSRSRWVSLPIFRWGTVAACAVIVVAAMRMHPGYNRVQRILVAEPQSQQTSQKVTEGSSPTSPAISEERTRESSHRMIGKSGKAKAVPELIALRYDNAFYRQMALLKEGEDSVVNRAPRWTLAADGTLQRSLDGGVSWKKISVAPDQVFRAVAAEGQNVWLGGKRGVLFLSADAGKHWSQMKRTANQPLPDSDIVRIEFEDELHGKLITADNESWNTSDGGQSWQKQ